MIQAACHCGAAQLSVPSSPTEVSECNCSICRRIGARWALVTALFEARALLGHGASAGAGPPFSASD